MLFEIASPSRARAAASRCWANGKLIGEGRLDHTCTMLFMFYAGMDMGRDNGGVVHDAYEDRAPFTFTGRFERSWWTSSR